MTKINLHTKWILGLSLLSISSLSCNKERPTASQIANNSEVKPELSKLFPAQYTTPSNPPIYMFTYFNSNLGREGVITNFPYQSQLADFLQRHFKDAQAINAKADPIEASGSVMGGGLYFAEDPFSSLEYGDTLLIVTANPGAALHEVDKSWDRFHNKGELTACIKSSAPAISYPFRGSFSGSAIAVRSIDFIAQADGMIIKRPSSALHRFNRKDVNTYISAPEELASKPFIEVLQHHMPYISLLGGLSSTTLYEIVGAQNATCKDLLLGVN